MALWKITSEKIVSGTGWTNGEFHLDFSNARFGPYTHIFHRENLYFHEEEWVRGSYFFPLKDSIYDNTELFLENNDIVIWVWVRGSFSGQEKQFIEIISRRYQEKYRLYPDEVQLVYNTKDEIVIYYRKSSSYKKLVLNQKTLEKVSESSSRVSAFFKLLYNHTEKSYYRLYFTPNSSSPKKGYFEEQKVVEEDQDLPVIFYSKDFILELKYVYNAYIDVWESSLTWELAYLSPHEVRNIWISSI